MTARRSSTLRRRRLSTEILRLRKAAGLNAADVTKKLEWATGKLTRMERNEWQRPNPRDIEDLLDVYGISDEKVRESLATWAREGRGRGWWHPYRDLLSQGYSTLLGLEEEVATERVFELAVIPGILQTAGYARALMRRGPVAIDEAEIEDRVAVRMQRQKVLQEEDMRLLVVMDEAALRRAAGGPEVMREQMAHLVSASRLAKVTLQVIPFAAGTHIGTKGPFTILEFPEREDPDTVYVETHASERLVDQSEEVDAFHLAFRRLTAVAASPGETVAMIEKYS